MGENADVFVIDVGNNSKSPTIMVDESAVDFRENNNKIAVSSKDCEKGAKSGPEGKLSDKSDTKPTVRKYTVKDTIIGSVAALVATVAMTLASSAVQGLQQRWPDMELNVFRWSMMILGLGVYFIKQKISPAIPRAKIPLVLLCSVMVSLEQVLFFTAVNFLPLGFMAALFRASLVAMAAVAAKLIEKEPLGIVRLVGIALGILGIVLMWQPEFLFGEKDVTDAGSTAVFTNVTTQFPSFVTDFNASDISNASFFTTPQVDLDLAGNSTSEVLSNRKSLIPTESLSEDTKLYIGLAITLFAAFLVVMQGVSLKRKQLADYNVLKLMFWVGVVGLVWTSVLSFSLEDVVFIVSAEDLGLVSAYAILSTCNTMLTLFAMSKTSYFIVSIIKTTQIVFSLISQYTILAHIFPGQSNAIEIIGGVAVMIAASLPTTSEMITANRLRLQRLKRKREMAEMLKNSTIENALRSVYKSSAFTFKKEETNTSVVSEHTKL